MPAAREGAEGGDGPAASRPPAPGATGPRVDRARIDAVFGETLPEATRDDARGRGDRIDDDWWREQRPPHHG